MVCSCIAALLGAEVTLTDLPDRLRLLKKNIETNLRHGNVRGSAVVKELIWGDDPDQDLIDPFPDYGTTYILSLPAEAEMYLFFLNWFHVNNFEMFIESIYGKFVAIQFRISCIS